MPHDLSIAPAGSALAGFESIYEGLDSANSSSQLSSGTPALPVFDWEGAPAVCKWPELTKKGNLCGAEPGVSDPDGYCIGHRRAAEARARRQAQEVE